jgi:hypothetical protein
MLVIQPMIPEIRVHLIRDIKNFTVVKVCSQVLNKKMLRKIPFIKAILNPI